MTPIIHTCKHCLHSFIFVPKVNPLRVPDDQSLFEEYEKQVSLEVKAYTELSVDYAIHQAFCANRKAQRVHA